MFLCSFYNTQVTVQNVYCTQYIHFCVVKLDKFVVRLREMRRFGGEFVVTSHLSRTHKFAGDKLRLERERDGRKFIAWLSCSNYEVRHSKSRGCVRLGKRKEKLGVTAWCSLALGMPVYFQRWRRNVELVYWNWSNTTSLKVLVLDSVLLIMFVGRETGNMVNSYSILLS